MACPDPYLKCQCQSQRQRPFNVTRRTTCANVAGWAFAVPTSEVPVIMSLLLRALAVGRPCARSVVARHGLRQISLSSNRPAGAGLRNLLYAAGLGLAGVAALSQTVHLDAEPGSSEETVGALHSATNCECQKMNLISRPGDIYRVSKDLDGSCENQAAAGDFGWAGCSHRLLPWYQGLLCGILCGPQ